MPPRFPVLWITLFLFSFIALATLDILVGGFFFLIVLPAVLFIQCFIRWIFTRFNSPVRLRRFFMFLPAFIVAVVCFRDTNSFGGKQSAAISVALAGQKPTGIRDLHVHEDAWTDYVVFAYFRCDPNSLRVILEKPPFVRHHFQPGSFSFADSLFPELRSLPDAQNVVVYRRTDLEDKKGSCEVYTDSSFSFAYIIYGVD